ncbi:hypothetical protein BCR32DRAFT_285746 [Anaeromyces robustus]|uniref:A-kinase anchor protein 7-like phosphoesterase domain-containing protein n=1 Tax=Anaeromyces robustus TaxID=1754192 RepID=A0A1Y1WHD3_9FUNG|nr:hypothetical protein BCR32DRAFT_285746 [Anaeromyces robustus]|eukprot:ORX72534.1 hypothetical protein BCR32DRAFT_285746 [Anaeromyces robustus]
MSNVKLVKLDHRVFRVPLSSFTKTIYTNQNIDEDIVIKGYDEDSLQHARDLIFKIIEENLYADCMELSNDKDFLASILMPPKCLHLTISTMCLRTQNEIDKAVNLMRSLSSQIKGLAIMKGTIKNARVVYAEVLKEQSYNTVIEVSKFLIKKFKEAGIIIRESEDKEILLHATLINTIYYHNKLKNTYDSTLIFEQYGNINFGNVLLRNISLCEIGTKNADTGYKCLEKISLP